MWLGLGIKIVNWWRSLAAAANGPFSNHATLTDGLVSYWKLDEESGVRYDSVTATANDLTDNNTVLFDVGKNGNAASFVGANSEYLSVADNANTVWGEDGNGVSMSMWVKPNGNPTGYALIFGRNSLASDAERNFNLFTETGSLATLYTEFNAGARIQSLGSSLTSGVWSHLVLTFDPADKKQRLYKDGAVVITSTAGAGTILSSPTSPVAIGGWTALSGFFSGEIDEVAIASRVWTAGEIADLYNSGAGLFY